MSEMEIIIQNHGKILEDHEQCLKNLHERMLKVEVHTKTTDTKIDDLKLEMREGNSRVERLIEKLSDKIDSISQVNGTQNIEIAKVGTSLKGQGKIVTWFLTIVSSVGTGVIVALLLRGG